MIGQQATLTNTDKEVTIVGQIRWGSATHPNRAYLRYFITTSGVRNDDGKRIDTIRKPENVLLHK